jgi:hypothetical protein
MESERRGIRQVFRSVQFFASIEELQNDLDLWIKKYKEERPHQGRWCFGKTPMQTFLDAIPHCEGKNDRRLNTTSGKPTTSKKAPSVRSNTSCYTLGHWMLSSRRRQTADGLSSCA